MSWAFLEETPMRMTHDAVADLVAPEQAGRPAQASREAGI
jgi:hypothetical protein